MFLLLSLSLGLSEEPLPQRNDFSFVQAVSVYDQVQGLKEISPPFSPSEREQLWTLYFQTRLGVEAEDPDVFERILDYLIEDYRSQTTVNIATDIYSVIQSLFASSARTRSHRYPHRTIRFSQTSYPHI